jgi:hypothetical protein
VRTWERWRPAGETLVSLRPPKLASTGGKSGAFPFHVSAFTGALTVAPSAPEFTFIDASIPEQTLDFRPETSKILTPNIFLRCKSCE